MLEKNKIYLQEHLVMFDECLPVNPLPFLLKATDLIREKGTDYVKSDQIKAILWVILAHSYGQLATINLCEEWERLGQVFKPSKSS